MLARFVTVTEVFTKYAVPSFELLTEAFAELLIESVVTAATGTNPSSAVTDSLANDAFVEESENVAVTTKVYAVPFVRPVTVHEVAGAATEQVREWGVDVTVYVATVPVKGAVHDTDIDPEPFRVATTSLGLLSTNALTSADATSDPVNAPRALSPAPQFSEYSMIDCC